MPHDRETDREHGSAVALVPVVFWRLLTAISALAVIPSRSFARVRMPEMGGRGRYAL